MSESTPKRAGVLLLLLAVLVLLAATLVVAGCGGDKYVGAFQITNLNGVAGGYAGQISAVSIKKVGDKYEVDSTFGIGAMTYTKDGDHLIGSDGKSRITVDGKTITWTFYVNGGTQQMVGKGVRQ